ncbi:hypothetical protein F4677DRAFT_409814 [Hypoxylon crocopeplum]|nr:hypothetical protein F4677DRAFT_409814 [Hypoxylon crocopeplum]
MSSIIKTAASLACLATAVLASPSNTGSTQVLPRQHETDCAPGLVFYSCANGYRGCFAEDPCALPPVTAPACPSGTNGSVWQPTMYNLYPSEPSKAAPAVSYLQVHMQGDEPHLEQAAVFRGIPSGAKTCTVNWAQADEALRTFVVEHSGLIEVLPLTGFPAEGTPISSASVAPFVPADASGATHPDFTFWDQTKTAVTHTAGQIPCAEDIYVKLALDPTNGDGHVFMEQDAQNGFYITYTC